jgi:hypothetical protein
MFKKNSQHHDLDPIPDADVDRVSVDGFSEVRGLAPGLVRHPQQGEQDEARQATQRSEEPH